MRVCACACKLEAIPLQLPVNVECDLPRNPILISKPRMFFNIFIVYHCELLKAPPYCSISS